MLKDFCPLNSEETINYSSYMRGKHVTAEHVVLCSYKWEWPGVFRGCGHSFGQGFSSEDWAGLGRGVCLQAPSRDSWWGLPEPLPGVPAVSSPGGGGLPHRQGPGIAGQKLQGFDDPLSLHQLHLGVKPTPEGRGPGTYLKAPPAAPVPLPDTCVGPRGLVWP